MHFVRESDLITSLLPCDLYLLLEEEFTLEP
jgi:hypothetical protein